ncbi:DUF805 domain-containing protein [Massilia sp. PAMC28688]|uniref:DUF805 domain-containing protein n=1 Tax=Massilia sp. PAMC28688 TaxID=2861283 RepID=UPI001C626A53|nr:DUF805 domain-containing protein [Massilia sp. PAMC28688]QYF94281.1 DUF805 domain-containing protein [Massilia sp. PAMC28688]
MTNAYAAPRASLLPAGQAPVPSFWTFNGRIGRLRYLAYLTGAHTAVALIIGMFGLYLRAAHPASAFYMPMIERGAGLALSVTYSFLFARRRLQDMDAPWGWSLLTLIPFVHIVAGFILLFPPGSDGPNRHGPPPAPNSAGVYLAAATAPLVALAGMLAAILIPYFNPY